jgi:hypothetical protein
MSGRPDAAKGREWKPRARKLLFASVDEAMLIWLRIGLVISLLIGYARTS